MTKLLKAGVLVLMVVASSSSSQVASDPFDPRRWAEAERQIRRLAPTRLHQLPVPVARYLRRYGYTVPQLHDNDVPHNVIRGRFNGDRTLDVAVLGSRQGHSTILVFWGGQTGRVTKLRRRSDTDYLQTVGDDKIGYSRVLSVVGRKYILDHNASYGGPKPPPIRHDAINHGFAGKASEVLYYDGRRWYVLQGAD
jgi:hypothetical protein